MKNPNTESQGIIREALEEVTEKSSQSTDGRWLEALTVKAAPHIKEWDIEECFPWAEWQPQEGQFKKPTNQDIGIDVVAVRRNDGKFIAIQCKARQLDEQGRGASIHKVEIDKFASVTTHSFWAERWIVINGNVPISDNVESAVAIQYKPIKWINMAVDLQRQHEAFPRAPEVVLESQGVAPVQTKSDMQAEAVAESVRILRKHELNEGGGLPKGQARGRIILPCGTGKTRISLRIVEELTYPGELSIVLCPSIALVAQIRREYLQHTKVPMRLLAVCSDKTAGYDPKKEDRATASYDPTVDRSNVSASQVRGEVATDPEVIASWIMNANDKSISVIFGTYQSGHNIAAALKQARARAKVLIADEAHRTAGLKRKRNKSQRLSNAEERIRNFTLCHDNDAFPATYRVYQTATPRVYDTQKSSRTDRPSDWILRSMDDETVFGVELYRKSYVEAVNSQWLSDYRIIAMGINDREAYEEANNLAKRTKSQGHRKMNSADYMRGLAFALAMGGATRAKAHDQVQIKSCIAFMNTVDKSKNMATDLQTEAVKQWVRKWLKENTTPPQEAADYGLEHLDATHSVMARDYAKNRLATADAPKPYGIINVGIFGEGTDSPSLDAVAFLEPRKSPIDVIQAVGRAMRTTPDKTMGYIICPVVIPPNEDPEGWLSRSDMDEGWKELGQILLALRAHDQRIEKELEDLMYLYIPPPVEKEQSFVAIAKKEHKRVTYVTHHGTEEELHKDVKDVVTGKAPMHESFQPVVEPPPYQEAPASAPSPESPVVADVSPPYAEPVKIVTCKQNSDGSIEMRGDGVVKDTTRSGAPAKVNMKKTKKKAKDMINGKGGMVIPDKPPRPRKTKSERNEESGQLMLKISGMGERGHAISMNLLKKSGLRANRTERDLNILEESVSGAAYHLRADELNPPLARHFGIDRLKEDPHKKQADGCTIAALLMMNAAMLHQRISNGKWLSGITPLSQIKTADNVARHIIRAWTHIKSHDFKPVLDPAIKAIYAIEDSGKTAGLSRALRHIAKEAEHIAETYADMGADHAGPLFSRVIGNQASDGAFFTRPTAASLLARLTLDACGHPDWTNPSTWEQHKTADPACGSGTLLTAILADMKRRARQQGASENAIDRLQKLAVEETIKGLDINPVSMQLAASQLTTGTHHISYRRMGLHLMPYGPRRNHDKVDAGTLELLSQRYILPREGEFLYEDDKIDSQTVWATDAELEDAVEAVKDSRIVIMNPPFTNRTKMGEKFTKDIQRALRQRTDALEAGLVKVDGALKGFVDKNSIGPLFVALADCCLEADGGVLAVINPTIALSAASALEKRRLLAQRYHIHTIVTCHLPGQINMSQNTSINESLLVMVRKEGAKPPTRFIHLDRFPLEEKEVGDLHEALACCDSGALANGWGEVSYWPAERMATGDWTPGIWRSPQLAEAAHALAQHPHLQSIEDTSEWVLWATGQELRGAFTSATPRTPGSFPILKSKGVDGQTCIESKPDEWWIHQEGKAHATDKMLQKAGHLLITAGQGTSAARLTAVASDAKYVGNSWMPLTGLSAEEAKALAVFMNSTLGRIQLMSRPGKNLSFPSYSVSEVGKIGIPNVRDVGVCRVLNACWERTRGMEVSQFRDGECAVRTLWDVAVAEALGWDIGELERWRLLLHREPHVRGLGYNQYA